MQTGKATILILSLLMVFSAPGYAELGKLTSNYETEFGKSTAVPHSENGPKLAKGVETLQYEKDGWLIRVCFIQNWAQAVLYMKKKTDAKGLPEQVTQAERKWLLQHVGGKRSWKEFPAQKSDYGWFYFNEGGSGESALVSADGADELAIIGDDGVTITTPPPDNDLTTYGSTDGYLQAWSNERYLLVKTQKFEKATAHPVSHPCSLRWILNPPVKKKEAKSFDEVERELAEREWSKANQAELEENVKIIFYSFAENFGRSKGYKHAVDFLKKQKMVTSARKVVNAVEVKYTGGHTGKIDLPLLNTNR
jgi:hypothetical protein